MSLDAMKAAFALQGISPTDTLVLVALGNFADEDWRCWPSKNTLALMTKLSPRALTMALKRLEEDGYVAREARTRENGSSTSNRYTLHLGEGGQFIDPISAPPPRRDVAPGGQPDAPPERSLNHQKEGSVIRAPDPFEVWWTIYPRKVDKTEARKAFWKAAAKVTFDALCSATSRFSEEVKHRDRDKIPHPTTWLNRERWNDEPGENGDLKDGTAGTHHPADRGDARLEAMVSGARIAAASGRRRWVL